jgi:membrane-associated phospholipid phosphatase
MYKLLVSYDRPTNEFPSLHVALLAFTILVAARASQGRMPTTRRLTLLAMAAAWAAAVAYAAVATKQHYAIDLAAGLVLAWAVDRWTP